MSAQATVLVAGCVRPTAAAPAGRAGAAASASCRPVPTTATATERATMRQDSVSAKLDSQVRGHDKGCGGRVGVGLGGLCHIIILQCQQLLCKPYALSLCLHNEVSYLGIMHYLYARFTRPKGHGWVCGCGRGLGACVGVVGVRRRERAAGGLSTWNIHISASSAPSPLTPPPPPLPHSASPSPPSLRLSLLSFTLPPLPSLR